MGGIIIIILHGLTHTCLRIISSDITPKITTSPSVTPTTTTTPTTTETRTRTTTKKAFVCQHVCIWLRCLYA